MSNSIHNSVREEIEAINSRTPNPRKDPHAGRFDVKEELDAQQVLNVWLGGKVNNLEEICIQLAGEVDRLSTEVAALQSGK